MVGWLVRGSDSSDPGKAAVEAAAFCGRDLALSVKCFFVVDLVGEVELGWYVQLGW